MKTAGTYVYCLVAAARRPRLTRMPPGLTGLGPVRLLAVAAPDAAPSRTGRGRHELPLWGVVADAPAATYSERAINRGLSNLDWVSNAAVAHEAVVERFITAPAVLPMKLFTIFISDARALAHFAGTLTDIRRAVTRVSGQQEWGVRVVLDRARASSGPAADPARARVTSGAGYLQHKKAHYDRAANLAQRSRTLVSGLYEALGRDATLARRRGASELVPSGNPLLLDAAFLVARSHSTRFRAAVARQARQLTPEGYAVTLSGPWPPYTFMQD